MRLVIHKEKLFGHWLRNDVTLEFNKREIAALERAAAIAEEARELMIKTYGDNYAHFDEQCRDLGLIEVGVASATDNWRHPSIDD